MKSTMQDAPLLIRDLVVRGEQIYGDKVVFTVTPTGVEQRTFAQTARSARQLANALTSLGVTDDTRVATFLWNDQTHLEAYLAVPTMGAILHTLNVRLSPEQLAFVINDAQDEVIIVDASLVGLLARVKDAIPTVRHIIVKGADTDGVLGETLSLIHI